MNTCILAHVHMCICCLHVPNIYNGKFVLFKYASRAHCCSYHRLLDIKHMVMLTYFFRGNLLSPHRLLSLISSKGSFMCTFQQTGHHKPQPLMDQLWTTGWNGK